MVVNLCLNPYTVAVDLEQFWVAFPNDIYEGPPHAMYTGRGLQWLWREFDNDIRGSFDTPVQYEYKSVVTRGVGIWCIWFVLTKGATPLVNTNQTHHSYTCYSNCKRNVQVYLSTNVQIYVVL